ncbi:hypothetical protein [Streptomyces millisiae]|uniref:Uncharacterized protein n=1 Tax=Streptomyces millisiae TaxID=3075542 RepID=A0ABU2LUS8_9ACTN|nr:hypothetical protein [Streptomyces sp. DSM 44918]MDT0321290.1 hypothetical protein [Streptomyces sp. DSM 44918]
MNRLTLHIAAADHRVQTRPLVDGVDLLATALPEEPGMDPRHLPTLTATAEPHEARLAEAECMESCCGALYVTITRTPTEVRWHGWRDPDRPGLSLPTLRFPVSHYDAELARAMGDFSWEWPARTIARHLEPALRDATAWLTRWECDTPTLATSPATPTQLDLLFFHRPTGHPDAPWLQFRRALPLAEPETLYADLTATDPRTGAEVVGGSAEFAERLGYPWLW